MNKIKVTSAENDKSEPQTGKQMGSNAPDFTTKKQEREEFQNFLKNREVNT